MKAAFWFLLGVACTAALAVVVGVIGLEQITAHFYPDITDAGERIASAKETLRAIEDAFNVTVIVGGITLTCTVGYLSLPQERFSEAAQRLANQVFCQLYQDEGSRSSELAIAHTVVTSADNKSRPSLVALYTLISIPSISPWTFRPNPRQCTALGNDLLSWKRGRRIAFFVRGDDVAFVACLAAITALVVLIAALFLAKLLPFNPETSGPWPKTLLFARVGVIATVCGLALVMAIALSRAITFLSIRRAIDAAREQEEGMLADKARQGLADLSEVGLPAVQPARTSEG